MNSHKEYEFIKELGSVMNQDELTVEEIDKLIYPVS